MVNKTILEILEGKYVSEKEMTTLPSYLLQEEITDSERAAFLSAIHVRGEDFAEISGFSEGLRNLSSIGQFPDCTDIVGTGGDMKGTINVSTAASLVCASLGIRMGKYGNRSITGRSGAADFMEMTGYNLERSENEIKRGLEEDNFVFLLASHYNSAFRSFSAVRKKLGHRTIFNLMGPITNPLNPRRIIIGCTDSEIQAIFSRVMMMQGKRAMVLKGNDGMDEISYEDKSTISIVGEGIENREIDPLKIMGRKIEGHNVTGKTREEIFIKTIEGLDGKNSDASSFIALNAAPCLILNGIVNSMERAYMLALKSMNNGTTMRKLSDITGGKVQEVISSVR